MALTIRSPDFEPGSAVPTDCTCEGSDRSPALVWSGTPEGTRSLALIIEDPDAPDPKAPRLTWVHWILYDIPADVAQLPPDAGTTGLPPGTREGTNTWLRTGYGGPCPPIGRHRYFHRLFALDTLLGDLRDPTADRLRSAMRDHVLAEAELMGTYRKAR